VESDRKPGPWDVVHQVVPSVEYGDAISNYALVLRDMLRTWYPGSKVFAGLVNSKLRKQAEPLSRIAAHDGPRTAWLFHYSARTTVLPALKNLAGPIGLIYQNVTPGEYMSVLGGEAVSAAYMARQELREFLLVPRRFIAPSSFNAEDLRAMGVDDVAKMPIALDFAHFDQPPLQSTLRALTEQQDVVFVSVGRLAPHKKLEDVLKIFYYFHNYINSRSRLVLVGDGTATSPYVHQLNLLIEDLSIPNVHLTGKVRFRELLAYYRAASAYVCMSEHEGFCVPPIEAMYLGVPVMAYAGGAIEETLGDAGILVREKRADVLAETLNVVVNDDAFRSRLIEKGKQRARDFTPEAIRPALAAVLESMG